MKHKTLTRKPAAKPVAAAEKPGRRAKSPAPTSTPAPLPTLAPPVPAERTVPLPPDLQDYTEFEELRTSDIASFVARRASIKAQVALLEKEQADLDVEIGALLEIAGVPTCAVWDHRVTLVPGGTTRSLSKTLLLQNGVTADIIERSHEERKRKGYLKITHLGEKS